MGKSALSIQAVRHNFVDNYFATVGVEFFTMNIKLGDKVIKLQIWDTCGQEVNSSLAFVVYSIDK